MGMTLRRFVKPTLDGEATTSDESRFFLCPCLFSSEKATAEGEKRVRFAEGIVDNECVTPPARSLPPAPESTCRGNTTTATGADHRMPANREALYRGMLHDLSVHRTAYSY